MNAALRVRVPGQEGATAVEFALISSILFTVLFGCFSVGLGMYFWNTAVEATRMGARIAVVCDLNDSDIKSKIAALFPLLSSSKVGVVYEPSGCTAASCETVTVSVTGSAIVDTSMPFVPFSFALPSFSTTLSRESMQSSFGGAANPVCQ